MWISRKVIHKQQFWPCQSVARAPMFGFMNPFDLLDQLSRQGMSILSALHRLQRRSASSPGEIAARFGWDPAYCKRVLICAGRLLDTPDSRDLQAANDEAHRLGLSLDTLLCIDKRVRQINNVETHDQHRLAFTRKAGTVDFRELDRQMRETVAELNREAPPPNHVRARVSKRPDIRGLKYINISGPATKIDNLVAALTVRAAEVAKAHDDYTHDRCLGQALAERLIHGSPLPAGIVDEMRHQPALIITPEDLLEFSPRFAATSNGSVLRPEEFINALLANRGWALVYDDNHQPIDLYQLRRTRLATEPQRLAMIIDNPICSWPGCDRPAHSSQAHHLLAYKHGGETTMANLTMLCHTHNAWNDDNRQHINGHMIRDETTGHACWVPPDTTQPRRFNHARATALAGRAYADYKRRKPPD